MQGETLRLICLKVCMFVFLTFRIFVKVCDVSTLIRANSLRADAVTDGFLLTVDLTKAPVEVPLPVDLITVHLHQKKQHRFRAENPLKRHDCQDKCRFQTGFYGGYKENI